jgi:DNA (cytosine-5)-methyltransferase 1
MSLGLQEAGFNVIAAFDNWKPAVEVYKKNFKHPIYQHDLTDENTKELIRDYHPDVIVGGPPCQDFSTAGPGVEQRRAELTVTFAEIVANVCPRFFIMENVPVIQNSTVLVKAIAILKQAGYGLTQKVLDASYCGVPQARKRFFLIGHLGGADDFLSDYLDKGLAEKPMTMYDYFGDSLGTEYYFRVPTNYSRRGVFSIYEPCVAIRGIDRPIPKGYTGHPNDPVKMGPKVRALTVAERSYVQTFPKDFIFEGGKSDLNQMIGNAVPVHLAQYVGQTLLNYIKDIEKRSEYE